jgi:hypothetical protein
MDGYLNEASPSDDQLQSPSIHLHDPMHLQEDPIHTRAWTLQEHLLPPRLLIWSQFRLLTTAIYVYSFSLLRFLTA